MKFKRTILLMMLLSVMLTAVTGGTIAWFTDSVSSTENVIQSGNLDMVVEYKTSLDGEWAELKEDTKLFKENALYEPGYTELVFLRVKNAGNLAFKYKADLAINNSVIGTSVLGNEIKLSDYMQAGIYVQDEYSSGANYWEILGPTMFRDRATALSSLTLTDMNKMTEEGTLTLATDKPVLPGEQTSQVIVLALHMPETVGNEANHKTGTAAPQINLGLHIAATQFTHEEDIFDNQYDKDATYPDNDNATKVASLDELKAALAEGGNIKLTDSIELDEVLNVAEGAEVYLDMNGKTITAKAGSAADPVFYTYKGSTLTITGNGTVKLEDPFMSLAVPYGDVVIENGTFVRNVPAGTPANQVGALFVGTGVSPWGSQSVTINGGYFDGGYYDENAADIEELLAGTKTLTETADDIAKRGVSTDKNAVRVAIKNNVSKTLNLSSNLFKVKGGTFVGMNPAWGDEGCMLPTTPNYLRPWSYYQGALIEGQTFNENGIVLPAGYTITKGATADGRPTYTVNYSN